MVHHKWHHIYSSPTLVDIWYVVEVEHKMLPQINEDYASSHRWSLHTCQSKGTTLPKHWQWSVLFDFESSTLTFLINIEMLILPNVLRIFWIFHWIKCVIEIERKMLQIKKEKKKFPRKKIVWFRRTKIINYSVKI